MWQIVHIVDYNEVATIPCGGDKTHIWNFTVEIEYTTFMGDNNCLLTPISSMRFGYYARDAHDSTCCVPRRPALIQSLEQNKALLLPSFCRD